MKKKYDERKYNSPFATRLRKIMEEENYSQDDIASMTRIKGEENSGVSRQAVSQYTNGYSTPSYDNLVRIADYLNVSIDWLLGRTNVRTTDTNLRSVSEYLHLSEEFIENLLLTVENVPQEKINAIFDVPLLDVIQHLYACVDIMMVNGVSDMLWKKHFSEYIQRSERYTANLVESDLEDIEEGKVIRDLYDKADESYKKEFEKIAKSGVLGEEASRMMHVQEALSNAWLDNFNKSTGFKTIGPAIGSTRLCSLIYANAEKEFQKLLDFLGPESDEIVHSLLLKWDKEKI